MSGEIYQIFNFMQSLNIIELQNVNVQFRLLVEIRSALTSLKFHT